MRSSLGIDLGTTNSVIAANAQVLTLHEADKRSTLMPSVVSFLPSGETLVGEAARERRPIDPINTVYSSKRLMGAQWTSYPTGQFRQQYPHALCASPDGGVLFQTRAGAISPSTIATTIVKQLCARAHVAPASIPTVVTIPSSFDEGARHATTFALAQSGFTDIKLIEEPVAIAIAYLQRASLRYAAVYDFGGGTFDFAIVDCSTFPFRVLAHAGDPYLGGDDIDHALAGEVATQLLRKTGWDVTTEAVTFARLMMAAEQAKCGLSIRDAVDVDIASIDPAAPASIAKHTVTRAMLDAAAVPLIRRTFGICDEVLAASKLHAREVQAVFLAGGSTRLPALPAMLSEYFARKLRMDLNPEHVVALGASMTAARPNLWPLLDRP